MVALGYRRSGPPYGRASATTAAVTPRRPTRHSQALESPDTPRCDDRLSSGGGVVALRVRARKPVFAGD
jgi:hypothetical protein